MGRELYSGQGSNCHDLKQQARLIRELPIAEPARFTYNGIENFVGCVGDGVVRTGNDIVAAGTSMQKPLPLERLQTATTDTTRDSLAYLRKLAPQNSSEALALGQQLIGETRNYSAERWAVVREWLKKNSNTSDPNTVGHRAAQALSY